MENKISYGEAKREIKKVMDKYLKFKVGDRVKLKLDSTIRTITDIDYTSIIYPYRIDIVYFSQDDLLPLHEFTEDEKTFLRNIKDEYQYIARDEEGRLWAYANKPIKKTAYWECFGTLEFDICDCFKYMFDTIQWSDEEPCEFRKYLEEE